MRVSKKVLATSFAVAVGVSGLTAAGVLLTGGSAGAQSPDSIQYVQQTGSGGTYIKYVPGNGSPATTEAITSGGGCATPTPAGVPLLNFSGAVYANTSYGLPATSTPVGAYRQRTGVCVISPAWGIEPSEALTFSVGSNSLVQGRLLTSASIDLANNDKSGSTTGAVQLIEYHAGSQVGSQTVAIPATSGATFIASTGQIPAGFDSIQIRVPSPPSASSASVSVVGPSSNFYFGSAALTLTKTDNLAGAKYDHVGQKIGYTLTATNAGTLTLHNVNVSDNPALDSGSVVCTPAIPAASLEPNASIVCTGTHTVTQADLNAGSYTDTASASSTETPTATTASDTVNANQVKSLTITKSDNLAGAKYDHVGQVVTYTLTATNAGNVTLHNVNVSDNPALASFSCTTAVPAASLDPPTSVVCTGTHTVTQADLDAGSLNDTASASSTETPTATTASDTVNANQTKSLTLTKTDSLNGATYSQPGQVVTYTLTAFNAGNVTLHNVNVSDNPALASFSCTAAVPAASLDPNASIVCTGSHTITLADLQAGTYSDTAAASSTETPTPTTATDTITAATQQLCGGQTISTASSASAGAVQADITLNGNSSNCKNYTYFAAAAGGPNTNQPATVTFLSQQVATAHVTAKFVWGYDSYCTPDGANNTVKCPATTYDLGSGPQPQTFCAAANPDPNVGRLWCTTSRNYQYVTDVSTGLVVTQITETWDGYGDLTMRH